MWKNLFKELKNRKDHQRYLGGLDIFKYIGPGMPVTVGFIDRGPCCGFRLWLCTVVGSNTFYGHADRASA